MKAKLHQAGAGALLLVLVLMLAGCGADPPTAAAPATVVPVVAATIAPTDPSASETTNPTPAPAGDPGSASPLADALATATVLAGPADGGPAPAGIDLAKVDACALLSQAEIEAVLGLVTYDPHAYQSTGGAQKQCIYVATVVEDNDQVTGQAVNLVIWPIADWEMLKTARGGPVSGIGDEAYTSDLGPTGLALWALFRDRAVVNVEVFPKNIAYAQALARTAAGHLP